MNQHPAAMGRGLGPRLDSVLRHLPRTRAALILSVPAALLVALPQHSFSKEPLENCVALLGTGNARASSPGTAQGTAKFLLGAVPHTATLDLTFAFGAPAADGSTSVVSTHRFSVRNKWGRKLGSFHTSDSGTLAPNSAAAALNLELAMTIIGGTGRFQGVTGTIADRGFLSLADNAAASVSALAGKLCWPSGGR